jgi:IS5 family transposase
MSQASEQLDGIEIDYGDHNRRAKRRKYQINNAKKAEDRRKYYRDLIKIIEMVQEYARGALLKLQNYESVDVMDGCLADDFMREIERILELADKVRAQTIRRVLNDEKVPSEEKVTSIFEPHTDIIEKGARETIFGHKVCVSSGKSGLILDCMVLEGNPSDTSLVKDIITRHQQSYSKPPRQLVFDGGFASTDNVVVAQQCKVDDVVFPKKKGIELSCSDKVFKMLTRFRAGIEAGISALKRSYGFSRVLAKGWRAFKTSLLNGVAAFNLTLIARHKLKRV